MKNLITLGTAGFIAAFSIAMVQADDASMNANGNQNSVISEGNPNIPIKRADGQNSVMPDQNISSQPTSQQPGLADRTSCTDENGITFHKGQKLFQKCQDAMSKHDNDTSVSPPPHQDSSGSSLDISKSQGGQSS